MKAKWFIWLGTCSLRDLYLTTGVCSTAQFHCRQAFILFKQAFHTYWMNDCENTSFVQSEIRKIIVLHTGRHQMASNFWNVSVSKKISQYVWIKNIIPPYPWYHGKCLNDSYSLVAMHQKPHSFAALASSLFWWIVTRKKIVRTHFPQNNLYILTFLKGSPCNGQPATDLEAIIQRCHPSKFCWHPPGRC